MADSDKSKETEQKDSSDLAETIQQETSQQDLADDVVQDDAVQDDVDVIDAEVVVEDQPAETDASEPQTESTPETPAETAPVTPEPQTVVVRKGGFFPVLIGGVLAAGVGFVAGRGDVIPQEYLPAFLKGSQTDVTALIDAQSQEIASLGETIAELQASAPDLSGIEATISDLGATVETVQGNLSAATQDLTAKIDGLVMPTGEGANASEVAALRALLDAQNEKIDQIAVQADAQMQSAQATVAQLEANAVTEAKEAEARSALSRIQAALQTGDGFAAALSDLQAASDVDVPEALTEIAQSGVPSVAALSDAFPDAARDALAAARANASPDDSAAGGRLAAFIARQTGARSVEPREGSDPDAVLSRVEAAVQNGAFTDAFAEIETLPEEARAALSDWMAQAQSRMNAVAASDALSAALKSN